MFLGGVQVLKLIFFCTWIGVMYVAVVWFSCVLRLVTNVWGAIFVRFVALRCNIENLLWRKKKSKLMVSVKVAEKTGVNHYREVVKHAVSCRGGVNFSIMHTSGGSAVVWWWEIMYVVCIIRFYVTLGFLSEYCLRLSKLPLPFSSSSVS